jgi:hypothetical protein
VFVFQDDDCFGLEDRFGEGKLISPAQGIARREGGSQQKGGDSTFNM